MKMLKMYINKANKLSKNDRFSIVYQLNINRKVVDVAKRLNVSRQTIYDVRNCYLLEGAFGLQDKKPGKLAEPLNPAFYANVIDVRKKFSWGALRLENYFKKKGFLVSHNKINDVINFEGLTRKKMGKREKPSYISYQVDNPNDQWHIDWSIDPLSKKKLLAILDDRSRFIVYVGLFDEATAENSAFGLQKAIATFGAPKELVSDNGLHFKHSHDKKIAVKPLRLVEEKYAIKHIFIRPYYPQSNGKIERWFGSYKGEFPLMNYEPVKDCITYAHFYNFERIHQSLDYETPASIYLGVK